MTHKYCVELHLTDVKFTSYLLHRSPMVSPNDMTCRVKTWGEGRSARTGLRKSVRRTVVDSGFEETPQRRRK